MKQYYLNGNGMRLLAGETPPLYDGVRNGFPIADGFVATFTPEAFTIEEEDAPDPVVTPSYRTVMTPLEFKGLFDQQERFAIESARAYAGTDAAAAGVKLMLNIFFSDIDDVRTTRVDVADARVIGGLDFCAQQKFITDESATAKKLGIAE